MRGGYEGAVFILTDMTTPPGARSGMDFTRGNLEDQHTLRILYSMADPLHHPPLTPPSGQMREEG